MKSEPPEKKCGFCIAWEGKENWWHHLALVGSWDSHLGVRPEVSTAIYTKTVQISEDWKLDLCNARRVKTLNVNGISLTRCNVLVCACMTQTNVHVVSPYVPWWALKLLTESEDLVQPLFTSHSFLDFFTADQWVLVTYWSCSIGSIRLYEIMCNKIP